MNIVAEIMKLVKQDQQSQIFRGEVTAVSGNLVSIRRVGYPADNQLYTTLASYTTPVVGDEVLCTRVGDGVVVQGEILR